MLTNYVPNSSQSNGELLLQSNVLVTHGAVLVVQSG